MFLGEGLQAELLPNGDAANSAEKGIRARVRSEVRAAIEESMRGRDVDPRDFEREVESLTRKITAQILDEGRSPEEIQKMLAEGEINP